MQVKDISRNDIIRLVVLGVVVLLEGLAVLSLILKLQFYSLGGIYANVVSVAVFVLPLLVGLLTLVKLHRVGAMQLPPLIADLRDHRHDDHREESHAAEVPRILQGNDPGDAGQDEQR